VFTPNEYLWQRHPDQPKWEVFAETVRDVMCEETGLKKCDQTFKELNQYFKFMTNQSDSYSLTKKD
jgi:hypothetical protein